MSLEGSCRWEQRMTATGGSGVALGVACFNAQIYLASHFYISYLGMTPLTRSHSSFLVIAQALRVSTPVGELFRDRQLVRRFESHQQSWPGTAVPESLTLPPALQFVKGVRMTTNALLFRITIE